MSANHEFHEPTDFISSARFSPGKQYLAVSSWDSNIYLYRRASTSESPPFQFERSLEQPVVALDICWGNDDETLYTAGGDKQVRMLEMSKEEASVLSMHQEPSNKLAFSTEHNILLSTGWDDTLHVHDVEKRTYISVKLPAKPFAMALSAERAVIAMNERKVVVHDLATLRQNLDESGTPSANINAEVLEIEPWQQRESSLKFMTRAVACMPNGNGFATSSIEGRVGVEFFDPEAQKKMYAFKCHRQVSTRTETNPETGEEQEEKVDLVYPVNALAFHPIHQTFATGGGDGFVSLWDADKQRRVKQYPRFGESVHAVDFSPDGAFMAVGLSAGFEDGFQDKPAEPEKVKIVVRVLGDGEAKGKDKASKTKEAA